MRVVHFSTSSLAGAPLRLSRLLNGRPGPDGPLDVRLVDAERYDLETQFGFFEHDVVLPEAPDQALELAEKADILHLHNEVAPDSPRFSPIDFRALERKGARIVRHFHSLPELIARKQQVDVSTILDPQTPAVVIAQYPERFHPRARVVPNLLPIHDPDYTPASAPPRWDIVYSPSKRHSAWEERWNTKGAPETAALLDRLAGTRGARVCRLNGRPLGEVLAAKRATRVVVDDLVNGSYHLSGLEGLSMGKAVCCWLDRRMERLLRWVSGEEEHPFVSVRLEEAEPVLSRLVMDQDVSEGLGAASRSWMERCWDPATLAEHFMRLYTDLLEDPTRVRRQPELALDGPAARFWWVELPETVWAARAERGRGAAEE